MNGVRFITADTGIVTHKNADFDIIASSIAASLIYNNSIVAIHDSLNANLRTFLSIHKEFICLKPPLEPK